MRLIVNGQPEPYAETWIRSERSTERCEWCGDSKRMPRIRLCRACNRVRKNLLRLEKLVKEKRPSANGKARSFLDVELAAAKNVKNLCILEGNKVRDILSEVTGLELEHWFSAVAARIAKKPRLHYKKATMLGWTFTPAERQVLAYLFWQVFHVQRQYARMAVLPLNVRTKAGFRF